MKRFVLAPCLWAALLSCSHPAANAGDKHYPFTGKIVSLNPGDQTAAVDGSAIPNFMEAMTMDYPIKSKEDFQKLKKGDLISATVNVSDAGSYNLTDIKITGQAGDAKK